MRRIDIPTALCLVVVVGSSCNGQVTAPTGEATLGTLEFSTQQVETDQPVVLVGRAVTDQPIGPHPALLRTEAETRVVHLTGPQGGPTASDGGDGQAASRAFWAAFSDEELAELIAYAPGNRVSIGFKEKEAESGVDEQGQSITSDATVEQMKKWLEERGVTIGRESLLIPSLTAEMEPDIQLVEDIRVHENIDYLEPIFPGERADGPAQVGGSVFVALVLPRVEGGLSLRPGERVTAEYRQPDGSLITATATVRQ